MHLDNSLVFLFAYLGYSLSFHSFYSFHSSWSSSLLHFVSLFLFPTSNHYSVHSVTEMTSWLVLVSTNIQLSTLFRCTNSWVAASPSLFLSLFMFMPKCWDFTNSRFIIYYFGFAGLRFLAKIMQRWPVDFSGQLFQIL